MPARERTSRLAPWASFACLILLCTTSARADLHSAQEAYHAGDYPKAFSEYKELAQLGQPTAQYNLAVMYVNGQGTSVSNTFAYAWSTLAAENGVAQATALADRLRPELSPVSLKIAGEIHEQFSEASLRARLMPEVLFQGDAPDHERCHYVSFPEMPYPVSATMRGIEGSVVAEVTVMPDGRAHEARIVWSVPNGLFDDAARTALRHAIFRPGHLGAKPAPCTTPIMIRYVIEGAQPSDYEDLPRLVTKTRMQAESGDVGSQMLYALMLEGLPQLAKHSREALPWFVKAAQAGAPFAQYQVGNHLLRGHSCNCDENKAITWLQKAAASDQPDAQITLATYALSGTPSADNIKRAQIWLERAAAHGSGDGKLYLSALLAAAPVDGIRDPKRALSMIDEVLHNVADDPMAFEIRAAARANQGEYDGAAKDQSKAIRAAKSLSWDLTPLNERLARYQAHESWQGNLLAF